MPTKINGIAHDVRKIRLGGPSEGNKAHSGPLISERQLHRVMGYIDEGKRDMANDTKPRPSSPNSETGSRSRP